MLVRLKALFCAVCISMLLIGFYCTGAGAAPQYIPNGTTTLIVEDGQLIGATGVSVKNTDDTLIGTFNVLFVEDSARDIYGTRHSDGSYTYNFGAISTPYLAARAANALMEQVLVNVDETNKFDSIPSLTYGVTTDPAYIYTAYAYDETNFGRSDIDANYVKNYSYLKQLFTGHMLEPTASADLSSTWVYAVWTEASTVPVPGSLLMLSFGLLGLVGTCRRQNK